MEFPVEILAIVLALAVLANRLVAAFITPLFEKYQLDRFWLLYVAWAVAGVLVWLTGVNLFAAYIPSALAGQILTAICAGGGANLFHDLVDKPLVQIGKLP